MPDTHGPDKQPPTGGPADGPPNGGLNGHNGHHAAVPGDIEVDPLAEHNQRVASGEKVDDFRPSTRKLTPEWPAPFRGPMADAVDAVLEASPMPRPVVATASVLSGFAASINGAYHAHDSDMRCNINTSVVLPTAGGKDLPRKAAEKIALAAGAQVEGKPASGAALEQMLQSHRPMLLSIDEAAHFIASSNGKHAPPYLRDLNGLLLQLFSSSGGVQLVRAYANGKVVRDGEKRVISHPCVSPLKFATVSQMAEALQSTNVLTGEMPRELFVHDTSEVGQRRGRRFVLPASVERVATALRGSDSERAMLAGSMLESMYREIGETDEATAALAAIMKTYSARKVEEGVETLAEILATRHYEKVVRIANVLAVWDSPSEPCVGIEHVAWAESWVLACDICAANYFGTEVHDDQRMRDVEKVRKQVERALAGKGARNAQDKRLMESGQAPWSLVLKTSKLSADAFKKVVDTLVQQDEVVIGTVDVGGQRSAQVLVAGPAWGQ